MSNTEHNSNNKRFKIYKYPIIDVEYSRFHVFLFLLTLSFFTLGLGGCIILAISVFGSIFIPHTLLSILFPIALFLLQYGKANWYFENIDAVSNQLDPNHDYKKDSYFHKAKSLIIEINSDIEPIKRQELRMELKEILINLEQQHGTEPVKAFWEMVPYLKPINISK